MRDIIVTLLVLYGIYMTFRAPIYGVLTWVWLGFMNPHRLCFGFAYNLPFAQMVALALFASLFMSKEKYRVPWTRESILLLLFTIWCFITTTFALYPDYAWPQWDKVWKIQLINFIMMMVVVTPERIKMVVWMIALSLGFYGIKGGFFTVITGGSYRVWGPDESFIGGNNELGLAMILTIPMIRFLQLTTEDKRLRIGLGVAMVLSYFSIIGTQSRGAMLGSTIMLFMLIMKSRKKALFGGLILVLVPLVFTFMPQEWVDRMNTIKSHEEDESAMGRINAWWFAFNLANDRPFVGGGFETFRASLFKKYAPKPNSYHDAHSIYFEILGEQGYVGLFLFLALGISSWYTAGWIRKHAARGPPDMHMYADLAGMIQVSLIAYAATGAFLGMAYFDLYYALIALLVVMRVTLQKAINEGYDPEADESDKGSKEPKAKKSIFDDVPQAGQPVPGRTFGPSPVGPDVHGREGGSKASIMDPRRLGKP